MREPRVVDRVLLAADELPRSVEDVTGVRLQGDINPELLIAAPGGLLASDAIEARRNEAEVMYRVPSYPPPYADNNDRVDVQPSYRAIPSECDELIDSGNGYYYCDGD